MPLQWWCAILVGLFVLWIACLEFICCRSADRIKHLERRVGQLYRQVNRLLDQDPHARILDEDSDKE